MTAQAITTQALHTQASQRLERNWALKTKIIDKLGLSTRPEYVSDNQPLFGSGLEMDSLDTLEVVVLVNNEFGVSISDDDAQAFGSINAMTDFIEAHS